MLRIRLIILVLFMGASVLQAREITFDDLYRLPSSSDPQIAPDGKRVVFVLQTSDPVANERQAHLWMMNIDGTDTRQITFGSAGESNPRWSPDGATILFLSNRDETSQVWMLPLAGGEAHQMTSIPTGVSQFECFPSGHKIIIVSRVFPWCATDSCAIAALAQEKAGRDKPKLYEHLMHRAYNRWADERVNRLMVVDLDNAGRTEVYSGPYDAPSTMLAGYRSYSVSPDGKQICFAMNTDSIPAVWPNNNLYMAGAPGQQAIAFTNDPGLESTPRYSPDGKYLAYLATARGGYESDQNDLIIVDRTKNRRVNLTTEFDRSVGEYLWDRQSHYLYLTASEHGFEKVWRIDVTTGAIEKLLDDAVYGDLRVTPDGRYLIVDRSLSDQPYELFRYDLKSRQLLQLTTFTRAITADLDMKRAEEFWFVGAFGDSIQGFLTLPPGFDANRKYPLALLIHGGPQACWTTDFNYYGWNTQLVAAQGYIVAQINPHGSSGYGVKFQDYVSGNWGKGDFEDLMKGLDFLISRYSFIDYTHMAALGRSYGGYMVNWICGHTNRFSCLVSVDGSFDELSAYGSTDELWFPEWEHNGTPWTNRDEYIRCSPSTYADHFKTPTLVFHGQKDYRVDVSQGLQMYTALQRQGVPSQLLYFPTESHSVGGLANLRVAYQRQFEWLARWLKERPGDKLIGLKGSTSGQ